MSVYRSRRPWWRTRAAGLITSFCGYMLLLVALCGIAATMLR